MNACPALIDLTAAQPGPAISDHLLTCRRCQALRAVLPTHEVEPDPSVEKSSTSEIRRRPSTGDFGLITSFDEATNLVAYVAAVRNDEAIVVPVSEAVAFATEWDLLVDQTVLGYPAIAEAWNSGVVLVEQLQEAIVATPELVRRQITELLRATDTGTVPDGLPVGVPVLSQEDPRLLFQEAEAEATRRYWQPRMMLASAATIGELVQLRQLDLGLASDDLEPLYDRPSWLEELHANTLALVKHEDAVVHLFRALRLSASARLATLLRGTIDQQRRLAGVNAGVQFSRRRAGTSGAFELDREEQRKREVDAFVSRVMRRLSEE